MSLAGIGVVAIWNDIAAEMRAEFYEWHNREHMPERVAIPGFLRGRRYIALAAVPEYFTLYETATPEVLSGADYLARLNAPTQWTRHTVAGFRNVSRSLCRVALSVGVGEGGLLMTWRYDVEPGRDAEHRRWLVDEVLPALAGRPGICGAHLCVADLDASNIPTEEKKGRPQNLVPNWAILVEGGGERAALEDACAHALPDEALSGTGACAPIERGLYRLEFTRSRDPGVVD